MGVQPKKSSSAKKGPKTTKNPARKTNNLASNQFYGASDIEPFNPNKRNSFDNPPFLWPKKGYTDITGREIVMQRGYMRSLITSPDAVGKAQGIQNRRLFFQFNPVLLQRSVQQSVGVMNPLLQDPAQLTQPIPGTASFGFELFFNREHEVAAGYDPDNVDYFTISDELGKAFVSRVGVLADILVLDTIIGQGLSQDIIDYMDKLSTNNFYENQSTNRYNQIITEVELLEKSGQEEEAKKLRATLPSTEQMRGERKTIQDAFKANQGNSAFLNPLPFRVLFSSLFMVEGLATSVDVQFQKFNRAMVPTQCKVTINMYALYIGFARKDTLLTTQLKEAAKLRDEATEGDAQILTKLDSALKVVRFEDGKFNNRNSRGTTTGPPGKVSNDYFSVKVNADRSDIFKEFQKRKDFTDVKIRIDIEYLITASQRNTVTEDELLDNSAQLLWEGKDYEVPLDKAVDERSFLRAVWRSSDLTSAIEKGLNDINQPAQYIHMRYAYTLIAKNTNGTIVESKKLRGDQLKNIDLSPFRPPTDATPPTIKDIPNYTLNNLKAKIDLQRPTG